MKTGKEKIEHQSQPDYEVEFGMPAHTIGC